MKLTDSSIALCLSGGGFRAALFHLGALQRLNELGILKHVNVISSVSGGSILNAFVAKGWLGLENKQNHFYNFEEIVAEPLREFCRHDLRTPLVIGTRINPLNWIDLYRKGFSISGKDLARSYEEIFKGSQLSDVPTSGSNLAPRFVFCATNMHTGACWQFHAGAGNRMGDFYTGYLSNDGISLAEAVAASSAFPFAFAALELRAADLNRFNRVDPWGNVRPSSKKRTTPAVDPGSPMLLSDGGVYDNLGVEPLWNSPATLLVSDGGLPFDSRTYGSGISSRLYRASMIGIEQAGAVRKRWLIDQFKRHHRLGSYWAINSPRDDYGLEHSVGFDQKTTLLLSQVRTDLNAFADDEIKFLENHGYSLAEVAIRSHVPELILDDAPFKWPHPEHTSDEHAQIALLGSSKRNILWDIANYGASFLRKKAN